MEKPSNGNPRLEDIFEKKSYEDINLSKKVYLRRRFRARCSLMVIVIYFSEMIKSFASGGSDSRLGPRSKAIPTLHKFSRRI